MTNFTPPEYIIRVLQRLEENGYSAYLVGGGVRDTLTGRTVHDWDAATSAEPADIARIFEKTVMTGARFGTVTVIIPECKVEVTTFRTEAEYIDGRHPESVAYISNLSEDLSRRDFTMNAIAVSARGEIIDPHGGVGDIKNCVIKCVGDPEQRFSEDALRMLRALRFSAELGFTIDSGTMEAIKKLSVLSARLSAERVRDELEKMLMSGRPELLDDMLSAGLLYGRLSSEACCGFEEIGKLPPERDLRWCAFCTLLQNCGAIGTAADFMREKMKLDGKTIRSCSAGADIALKGFPRERSGIKGLLARYGEDTVRCAAAADFAVHGCNSLAEADKIIFSGECYTLKNLAVTGNDLREAGFPSGAGIGEALNTLLLHVIRHPEDNRRELLLTLITAKK